MNLGARRRLAFGIAVACSVTGACKRQGLPPRPDGAAVTVATERPGDEVLAVAEVEPNDVLAKAQALLVTSVAPAAVKGTVAVAGGKPEADVFRIEVPKPDAGAPGPAPDAGPRPGGDGGPGGAPAGPPPGPRAMLRAELRPDGPAVLKLEAVDDAGRVLIAALGAEPGQPIVIPNLAVGAAAPHLRVRAARADAPAGDYRLIVRAGPVEAGGEIEPNATAATATELGGNGNGEAVGYLGWPRDQDWYRITTSGLADGSVLSVDFDPVPGVSAQIAIVDAAGQRLSEARGARGERATLRNVGVPAGAPFVYLSASAQAGWNADARYSVRVRAELLRPGAESEPNNDPAHAQAIGDGTVEGALPRGDVDVYRYAAAAPVALDVELAPPERAQVKVEVIDAAGKVIGRGEARKKALRLTGVAITGGSALIRVAAGRGEGNPDESYRMTVSARPLPSGAPGDEGGGAGVPATPPEDR